MIEQTPLRQKILLTLFGEPLHQDVGTTVDGQRAYEQINPLNPTLILTLLISVLLFAIYMWFYLSPLFREQPLRRKSQTADPEMGVRTLPHPAPSGEASTEAEKKSLISWIHRSSLGRFIDVTGRIRNHIPDRCRLKHVPVRRPTDIGIRPPCVEDYQFLTIERALSTSSSPLSSPLSLPLPLHAWNAHQDSAAVFLMPPPPAYSALSRSDGASSQFLEPRRCCSCSSSPPSLSLSPQAHDGLGAQQLQRLGNEEEVGEGRGTDAPVTCNASEQIHRSTARHAR
ncbi:hypothetical protein APHAL10511_005369 [Amanita phalloides]|nr:hypothetical protein APHAL10511_005369 [Amanita phalloides]